MDMIKVDACYVEESSETIVYRWKDMLNATGRPVLLSDCHNGCMHDNSYNELSGIIYYYKCINVFNVQWKRKSMGTMVY